MVKKNTDGAMQTLKEHLLKAFKLLNKIKPESLYVVSVNLETRETKELKHLPLTDGYGVACRNANVEELKDAIKSFLVNSVEEIEKNTPLLISIRQKAATLMTNQPSLIERVPEDLDNVTEFFRMLFNCLDRFITWARSREKTCAETYTPGAQTLIGRRHFLYKAETSLGTALKDFEQACNKLQSDFDASNGQKNSLG